VKLRTPLTELVGVEHPVVQTGMGWVAGARLVAATANAGGLGILASATMTLDELATAIGKVKAATDKPFGVNMRADAADAGDRVELMIREGVKVASFALAPKQELIARLKEAGAVVIPSIGAAKHARKVAAWGADAMIVQGGEGGGHTGPVATTLLLPSVLDAVKDTGIPVIAAGGFFDGRGLAAALSYGAAGFCSPRTPPCRRRSNGVTSRRLWTAPWSPRASTACRTACCAPSWSRSSKVVPRSGGSLPRCATRRSSSGCRR
jgi:NAD(P)H-dependent flavin oxidoreductase YrpB (nitropropane dioxygenase family)